MQVRLCPEKIGRKSNRVCRRTLLQQGRWKVSGFADALASHGEDHLAGLSEMPQAPLVSPPKMGPNRCQVSPLNRIN